MIVKVEGEFSVTKKFKTIVEVNFEYDSDSGRSEDEQRDEKIQEALEKQLSVTYNDIYDIQVSESEELWEVKDE